MPALRNSLNIRSRVMWVRAFFNTYKRRVIAAGGVIQNEPCAVRSLNNNLLRSASWTLVPSGIEEDIVFAQKPISGLGDLSFSRASDATYTDSTGVVRRSPYNLLTWSEMFSDVAWTKTNTSITANVTNAPNGTLTADELFFTASSGFHLFGQVVSLNSGNVYTQTYFVKNNGQNFIQIYTAGTGMAFSDYVNFDLTTGTISASSGMSGTITNNGNGWYRISATKTAGANGTGLLGISSIPTSTSGYRPSYTASGLSIYIWGAQLVEGTSALDYFPTTNRQDVPRIDFRNADGTLSSCGRLLLEPQRTNSIRNSSMVGAVAGTPGTLPTNWTVTNGGLTQTITGVGTENGLPYIEVRFNGTATGAIAQIRHDAVNQITAANGQVWSYTFYAKVISQPSPPVTYSQVIFERTSAGSLIKSGSQLITPTANLQRFTFTRTLDGGATVGAVDPVFYCTLTIGQTYDFTIRIAAPQMELGAYATTWVPTTTAAVTRIADTASKTGVSSLIGQTEGTFYTEVQIGQTTSRAIFSIDIGTTTNYIAATTNATNQVRFVISQASSATVLFTTSALTIGRHKLAFAYKSGDYALYIDGVQAGVSSLTTFPVGTLSQIVLNSASYGQFGDGYAEAILYPTRLDNATLAQMTTL